VIGMTMPLSQPAGPIWLTNSPRREFCGAVREDRSTHFAGAACVKTGREISPSAGKKPATITINSSISKTPVALTFLFVGFELVNLEAEP
jgi:hypothetical protein